MERGVSLCNRGKLNLVILDFKDNRQVGTVAYRLELPEQLSRVHSMFHVSNLKKCMVDEPLAIPLECNLIRWTKLHFIERNQSETWTVGQNVLKKKFVFRLSSMMDYRRGPEFTWEREDQMQKKYPHLFPISAPVADATS
ncbi:hypothetical protein Tco_0729889, partial [Tanacetum coccineum]